MERITIDNRAVPEHISAGGAAFFGELQPGVVPTFSGKTALAVLLNYFRSTGALPDKMSQVLVPPWLGSWIYMTMQQYCFPSLEAGEHTRGILVYHQWGFPQRMEPILDFAKEKNLFVIEDCAHAFESQYQNKRAGTFGDAAVFSLAKFFPCVVGGALYSSDENILTYARDVIAQRRPTFEEAAFTQRQRYNENPTQREVLELGRNYAIYDRLGECDPRAWNIASTSVAAGALQKRTKNAEYLRTELMPADEFGLFDDYVTPWVVPLFLQSKEQLAKVAAALERAGIESGVYRFDVNRNMLDPRYLECAPLPCHDGLGQQELTKIVQIVREHQ